MISAALSLLAQSDYQSYSTSTYGNGDGAAAGAALGVFFVIYMLFVVVLSLFFIACMWKIFTKAGKPGWAAIVPIYNTIVLLEVANKPTWWVILFFIPVANLVASILVMIELARVFGKSDGFAALLILVPVVALPMLAFGSATYRGSVPAANAPMTPPAPTPVA